MGIVTRFAAAAGLLLGAVHAHAVIIDLKAAAEPGGLYGESAWRPFSLLPDFGFNVQLDGLKNGQPVFAYLDANNAGMGVCGALNAGAPLNAATHSGANLCNPSSDDNITTNEALRFTAIEGIVVSRLWFNNNHDIDASLIGDTINIFGVAKTFGAGDIDASRGGDVVYAVPTSLLAGSIGLISFSATNGEQFYLSAIEISRVSEPGSVALLAVALAPLLLARRSRRR